MVTISRRKFDFIFSQDHLQEWHEKVIEQNHQLNKSETSQEKVPGQLEIALMPQCCAHVGCILRGFFDMCCNH